jgi:ElaA protein
MYIHWTIAPLHHLTPAQVYDIMRLRSAVFVVEQNCAFEEMDGRDGEGCLHLCGYDEGKLVAYARLLEPGLGYMDPSLGRICTAQSHRSMGLGKALMKVGLEELERLYPGQRIRIGAQVYLTRFYQDFGFQIDGNEYLEDGIPHIEMVREKRED